MQFLLLLLRPWLHPLQEARRVAGVSVVEQRLRRGTSLKEHQTSVGPPLPLPLLLPQCLTLPHCCVSNPSRLWVQRTARETEEEEEEERKRAAVQKRLKTTKRRRSLPLLLLRRPEQPPFRLLLDVHKDGEGETSRGTDPRKILL